MRRGTFFWGSILILLGILFLLDQMGVFRGLGISVWGLFWPLLLIVLGLWMLFGRFLQPKPISGHAAIPLEGAIRARLKVRHGAGQLDIHAGAGAGELVSGEFGGGLDYTMDREDDLLKVKMRLPEQNFPWVLGPGVSLDWSFGLNRDIPLSLDINTGASKATMDLSELRVTDLKLNTGASATELTLPANAGYTRMAAETGVASLSVRVPAGVAARIRVRSGLSSVGVDSARFPRLDDFYQSPDYDTAANKVDIEIESGVGAVDIR